MCSINAQGHECRLEVSAFKKTLQLTVFGRCPYFNCTTVTTGMCVSVCVFAGKQLNSTAWGQQGQCSFRAWDRKRLCKSRWMPTVSGYNLLLWSSFLYRTCWLDYTHTDTHTNARFYMYNCRSPVVLFHSHQSSLRVYRQKQLPQHAHSWTRPPLSSMAVAFKETFLHLKQGRKN